MEERILLAGGDRRQRELAGLLSKERAVDTMRVPGLPDTARHAPYAAVILPCPAFDAAGFVRAEGSGLPPEALRPYFSERTRLFGGGLDRAAQVLPLEKAASCDLLRDPLFTAENGRLTAEAALVLVMEQTGRSLFRKACAVLGYGRIAGPLASLLKGLGAEVTVAARRPEVLAQAEGLGFRTASFAAAAGKARFVFNTVPAPVLAAEEAAALSPEALWIELASAPGGLPAGRKPPCAVLPAGGLPGRLLPLSAARALYTAIERNWEE